MSILQDKIKKLEVVIENYQVKKVFLDVYPEKLQTLKARVMVLDPRILEIDNLGLFFDVFKKEVKTVRENYKYEPFDLENEHL